MNGPDADAGVVFVVFTTPAAAAASPGSAVPAVPGLTVKPAGKVAGQPGSALYAGSFTQTDALGIETVEGVTYAVVPHGNVLVAGFTYSPTKTRNGSGAVALVRSRPCAPAGRLRLIRPRSEQKRMGGLHQGGAGSRTAHPVSAQGAETPPCRFG